jgi:hypothetical protein
LLRSLTAEFAMQPGFGGVPVPHHGVRRNLQCFRGFFDTHADKVAQLNEIGFDRIDLLKSLQRLTLTSETKPFNTYGGDPDSYLKTMAWPEGPSTFKAGAPITCRGLAVCGLEGLKGVEYWLRPDSGTQGNLSKDDPAWKTATWQPCVLAPPPNDWKAHLPAGISSKELWGFDPETGKPKEWPLRYSLAMWTTTVQDLKAGSYELRVRSVDQNGFAQPEPRPQQASGKK